MTKTQYDLEGRTESFAHDVRMLTKASISHYSLHDDCKQVIRSSGSVAANYIEANEALSKRDFRHRIKICLKEAKESRLWLRLLSPHASHEYHDEYRRLIREADECVRIFSSILKKTSSE